jgi:broad specificity phosphatase PhoE
MPLAHSVERRHAVFLVRHGETDSNLLKRYAGRSSESLTQTGRQQARSVARVLGSVMPCAIYASRIARALETARLIASSQDLVVHADARLDELLMGPWEGLTESEIAKVYPSDWDIWSRRPHELRVPGRETLKDIEMRVMSIVDEASAVGPSILVTHVAPMRVAALSTLGLSLSFYKRVAVPNASCIQLDLERGTAVRYPSGICLRAEAAGSDGELAIA